MLDWELMRTSRDLVPMCKELCINNFHLEMQVSVSGVEVSSSSRACSEVRAVSNCKIVTRKELNDVSRNALEGIIVEMMSGAQDFLGC